MTENKIETQFNGTNNEKTPMDNSATKVSTQDSSPVETNENFQEHPIFKKYLPKELCAVLECWFSDGTLNEEQKETFRTSAEFLLNQTKTNPDAKEWICQETELIDLTEKCLNEIASYGYYIGIGGTEDSSLESFDWLIQAFENAQCKLLLDIILKCVTSRFYMDALRRLNDPIATSLTITDNFLLITCPKYIVNCDKTKTYSKNVANKMLHRYNEILIEFLPNIEKWTTPIIFCLYYPMKFVLANIRSLSYEQRKPMYNIILSLLLNIRGNDSNTGEARAKLIYTSLCILIEIVRSDRILSNQLKNETQEKTDLIKILVVLSKNESNTDIELKALELISLLVPEEEFRQDNSSERVTGLFVKTFNDALHDGKSNKADEILHGFKDLVQNDDIREEIMKQDALPSIMNYSKERSEDPLPLEVVYAMTFNQDANKVIREDVEFVDHVKQLRNSEIKDVSKMAHGIMWKIEGEEKFRKKEEERLQRKQLPAETPKDVPCDTNQTPLSTDAPANTGMCVEKEPEQYDMMISYSWAQQPLCHTINDRLEKDGYKVWLDRDEMRGSIIESMAEAVERSRFILIGMSSNYKKSTNCKAEAEYAFSRHSKIIPLIVEPHYKADGWLGFLAGSKIYIDFADKEGEEFDKAYSLLIEELKRNGLNDKSNNDEKKTDEAADKTETKPEEPKKDEEPEKHEEPPKEPEKPIVETKEYLNMPDATMWNDQNVLEFLTDKKLDQLIPICESMDGETLIEFHQSCEKMPDVMYGLLNKSEEQHPVSISSLFKFITKLKKYLPPKPEKKLFFRYNFVYPSANETQSTATTANSEQK